MSNTSNETMNKKRALGRGLGSLLQTKQDDVKPSVVTSMTTQAPPKTETALSSQIVLNTQVGSSLASESRVWVMGIDKLKPGTFQPRQHFEKKSLEELAQSIKENGILQPIAARQTPQGLEIVAGERRWRAAQIAGLHEVPVIIKNFNNKQALELAIVENIQREDLNPIEEAEAYQRLMEEFSITQQQVAERVGKDRATVANSLRLLALPNKIRQHVISGELSAGHAKVILSIGDMQAQVELAEKAIKEKLSVRKLEKLVEAYNKKSDTTNGESKAVDENVTKRLISSLGEEMQRLLGTKVNIDYIDGKGKLSIAFYSDTELTQIIERIRQGCQKH